jgi:AcrR family transcriptional regulator
MAIKTAKSVKEAAVGAALTLAAEKGWSNVSLREVAKKAKIALPELREHFDDRLDIIAAWGRLLDQAVLKEADPDLASPARDRLFDILMARFDALNENRDGAKAVLRSLRTDPKQAVIALPHLGRSMSWMLEAAGIEAAGVKGALKIAGLAAIYLKSLWVWCDDESADMAKTMAALDKNLGRAAQWADSFGMAAEKFSRGRDERV